jgi:predicted component of type VI protein secretion system
MPGVVSDLKARLEAERSGRPFLEFTDGDGRQQLFLFDPGMTEASIGRERSTDLVLAWDDQVSRLHARLERADEDWTVVDDGLSSNGTFVNGERTRGRIRLADGDTLRLGATTMTFRAPAARAVAPVGASPDEVDLSTTQRRVLVALCRHYKEEGGVTGPAGDDQLAEELFLSIDALRTHLMVLFAKFSLDQADPAQQRTLLVERAIFDGVVSEQDL